MSVSSFEDRLLVPGSVVSRTVNGESVLLDAASGRYFRLDEIATRAWSVLTSAPSIQAAYETLLVEYAVDADELRRDLTSLIDDLVSRGLLEVRRA